MNDYAFWYSETHLFKAGVEVTRTIASHLAARITVGSAVIVCDRPHNMHSAFIKRWKNVLRILENERATVLSKEGKQDFKKFIDELAGTKFIVGMPEESTPNKVWITEADDLNTVPKSVKTIYVMSALTIEQMQFWSRHMVDGGAVVIFRKEPFYNAKKP